MTCSFLYSHWEEILREAASAGYRLTSFRDYDREAKRTVILRHDVDTLPDTKRMAQIERQCGATATYFVRVHSGRYNPFSFDSYKAIEDLIRMGHELGLHFDGLPFVDPQDVVAEFNKEKTVLETMFDAEIKSASLHGLWTLPAPDYYGLSAKVLGIENYAYDPEFTRDMKYISDSCGRWREGCLCELLGKYERIQVLTHPIWWYERVEDAYDRW